MATFSLNSADIAGLSAAILDDFQTSLATVRTDIDPLIRTIPVTQDVVNVPFETTFANTIPKWLSEKEVIKLGAQFATVQMERYGVVYRIPRTAFEDGQLGLYRSALSGFGRLASNHKASQVAAALKNGTTVAGFDGVATFGNHDVGDGSTQSNNFVGAQYALSAAALQAVYTAGAGYHGATGNNLGTVFDTVIVGPALKFKAAEILMADQLPGGGTNTLKGTLNVIVLNELTDPNTYYLINSAASPLVYLERTAPEVINKFSADDPRSLMYDEFESHIRARGAAVLGPWPTIARVYGA